MQLDVHHLRTIRAIADTGSLSGAAVALGISQPAVSAQLKRLEQVLGYPLFQRQDGEAVATPMGELLLRRTAAVLPLMDQLMEDVEQRACQRRPPATIRVGAVCSAVAPNLSAVVARLWPAHEPSVLHEDHSGRLLSLLADHRIELALVKDYPGHELPVPGGLDTAVIVEEPTFVLLPEHHRLAEKSTVDLEELRDERWVMMGTDSAAVFHRYFGQTCAQLGFVPNITHRVDSEVVVMMVVRAGAVGLLQPACEEPPGIAVRALGGEVLRRRHILAWPRDSFVAERHEEVLAAVIQAYWDEARRSTVYRRHLPPT